MGKKSIELVLISLLIGAIFFLGYNNELKLLINPKYFSLVIFSLITLFIFIVVIILSGKGHSNYKVYDSRYILLTIMIGLMFSTSYSKFQEIITDSRGVNIGDEVVYNSDYENNKAPEVQPVESSIPLFHGNLIEVDDSNFFNVIDSLYINNDFYVDKEITIKGFVTNFEGLDSSKFVISRMVMLCCAADSSVYGLLCSTDMISHDFKENEWYELHGTITKQSVTLNGQEDSHPVIEIKRYTQIPEIEDPYIYPEF